jgi:RNA polymerase sigma-70 factor, ECF subfamily
VNDKELVAEAKNGNQLAFIQLVEKHQNSLYLTALALNGSSWDAYDSVQEALLKAYLSLGSLKDDISFRFWLTKILINKCHDQHRKTKRIIPTDYIKDAPCEFFGKEDQIDLMNALDKLDDKYRLILSLRYFQDLTVKEIATILDCPEGTVKSRLNQALRVLKNNLGYKNYEEAVK